MEKRFAYKFLKKLLKYVDSAQDFITHLGMMLFQSFKVDFPISCKDAKIEHIFSIQRQWQPVEKQTGPLMNKKSSFLPK